MAVGFYALEGETFSESWSRCWHEGVLGLTAYGTHSVIARMRRGKYVIIPPEWRGKVTCKQTIRKRQSKQTRKAKNRDKFGWPRHSGNPRIISEAKAPKIEDWA